MSFTSNLPRLRTAPLLFLLFLSPILLYLGIFPDVHVPHWGKILHFIGFFLLGLVGYYLFLDLSWRENLLVVTVLLLVGAIGSECVEGLFPYRTFDVMDIVANLLGSMTGLSLAMFGELGWRRRREWQDARYAHLVGEADWNARLRDDDEDDGDVYAEERYGDFMLDDLHSPEQEGGKDDLEQGRGSYKDTAPLSP